MHGEVDPRDPHNRIIQDLDLAPRNARGQVEYVATFALARPIDPTKASGVLIYQVVNRGNGDVAPNADGDITLVSGWQGDVVPTAANQTITVPVAQARRTARPSPARSSPASSTCLPGTTTMPIRLSSMGSGPPVYPPADLDEQSATLTMFCERESDRREGAAPPWCRARPGRSRTAARRRFRARPIPPASVSEGRLRSGEAVRARLHGQGSAGARRRSGRDARHRRRSSGTTPRTPPGRATPSPV